MKKNTRFKECSYLILRRDVVIVAKQQNNITNQHIVAN